MKQDNFSQKKEIRKIGQMFAASSPNKPFFSNNLVFYKPGSHSSSTSGSVSNARIVSRRT